MLPGMQGLEVLRKLREFTNTPILMLTARGEDTDRILGLELGEAHVIRDAGGVVSEDAIRSLLISQRLLGTREIILIHHTDCGMLTFQDHEVKDQIASDTGARPHFALEAFPDVEDDVRQSIVRLKANPFIDNKDQIRGFVFDVKTGGLKEIAIWPGVHNMGGRWG